MKDDELSTLLNKTRDYLSFIKSSLSKKTLALKDEDSEALGKIEAYLKELGDGFDHWSHINESDHKKTLSKCFSFLQHLDRIAKDYKLFQNDSTTSSASEVP